MIAALADELIILVDDDDREVGVSGKIETHRIGLGHRAFSIFLRNSAGEVLLQRRANSKYHSPGLWANSCCGHPRAGEDVARAARRRLREELGFGCELHPVRRHRYCIDVGGGMTENEYVHLFFGRYDGEVYPDADEVSDFRWLPLSVLIADAEAHAERYAPWLRDYLLNFADEIDGWASPDTSQ